MTLTTRHSGPLARHRRWLVAVPAVAAVLAALAVAGPAAAVPSGPPVATAAVTAIAAQPTLRSGSRGAAVTRLQQRLVALHYDLDGVDGVFGNNTLHAVYAFQKVQRIRVDGIVGPATWAKLAAPRVPKPRHTSSSAAVEIDLALRVVHLTRDGRVTKILDASPGKASTPTVTGSFGIYRRINGWRESPLGLLWRPNYFHRGYALHGSTSVPTYAASHGCVRVTVAAMNRIWSQLAIGERVYVYR
jgi:peptidoglycan hydrolase-like protein with peptidoglycan-binding domain